MRLFECGARRVLGWIDATSNRLYGSRWNPVHQSGTVAVAMLLALIASGLYLLLFYRVGSPSASVAGLAADPWFGAWVRSFHRYASDLFIIAVVLHMFRMFAQGRSWGPRTLAWVSGVLLFGVAMICAWTGFVMAWDSFGERLAIAGGRMLDVLPIFSEPLSRIFAGDRAVPSAFFFVNMFMHIGLPLAMGAMLWLHVSKVARPVLLPPRRMTGWIISALLVTSVLVPATLGPPADPFRIARTTPTDIFAAWWLPLVERLTPAGAWGAALFIWGGLLLIPRFTRRAREGALAPSVVDPRLCTGCNQCPQDCPWEAITMVPRNDGRTTLLAQVDPNLCVSCGICAGSCAPMGIGPPGRNGRDQLASLRADVISAASSDSPSPVVAICCAQAPASHTSALRARGAHIHSVSCVGNLHTSVIERFIRDGAPGVIVCGCPPRDCVNREGPKWLGERVYNDREAELQSRVDRRRVRTATLAPGELHESIAQFEAFVRDLQMLNAPVRDHDAELDPVCEPVPLGEET
jgi:ferredoxin